MIHRNLLPPIVALLFVSILMSCGDDPQPALEYKAQGYMRGTITGTSFDESYTFNDKFSYAQYISGDNSTYTYMPDNDLYYFSINRSDYNNSSAFSIYFTIENFSDTTPENAMYNFGYKKELKNKIVTFSMYSGFYGGDTKEEAMQISDFSFNEDTGRVRGKYTVTSDNNTTQKNASITGDFDVVLKKIIQ
jgi:lipopolysaccharide export LptBFGC system permease protein LptF